MSGDVFLDSNVLVYAVAQADRRSEIAAGLLVAGSVVSVQVLNEFTHVARRKLRKTWPQIREALVLLRQVFPWPQPMDVTTHELGLQIAERYGYAIFDGLIIASALRAGCRLLLSEDMADGQTIEGMTIRNPFAAA